MAEDLYDALPTRVYDRNDRSSGVLRAAPRDSRGPSPSYSRSNAPTLPAPPLRSPPPSPLATFSIPLPQSKSIADEPRISQMLRELPFVPTMDASQPLTPPNVFLTPPQPFAPPRTWSATSETCTVEASALEANARKRPRARRSIMPFVTAAAAIGIAIGLWKDDAVRTQVVSDLTRAAGQLGAFVVETATR